MSYKILHGDNSETLKTIADNSIDAIVTDPPYGIDFLGKAWDANTGALETYQECLRVLKPGGHILAFSAARTYHHLAVTLEQAGFEIRDQIMWIYSSGFPKSQDIGKSIDRSAGKKDPNYTGSKKTKREEDKTHNVGSFGVGSECPKCNKGIFAINPASPNPCQDSECALKYKPQTDDGKAWAGWGTQLKPAHEPIALARKPMKTSIARNCQKYGTGALNIDATRVAIEGEDTRSGGSNGHSRLTFGEGITSNEDSHIAYQANTQGRFPSNVLGEIPLYQKYFYCPKVSRAERHIGFNTTDIPIESDMLSDMGGYYIDENSNETKLPGKNIWLPQTGNIYIHGLKEEYRKWCVVNNKTPNVGNNHPTVKPIELMKYLIKLITPPGGTVLDPFNGSGSTGCAAVELGMTYIGCELDPAYVEITEKRIEAWIKKDQLEVSTVFKELFDEDV